MLESRRILFSSEFFGRWVAWGFGAMSFISGVFVVFVAQAFESLHFSSGCSRSRRWSTGSRWIGLLQWPRQERERGSKQIWKNMEEEHERIPTTEQLSSSIPSSYLFVASLSTLNFTWTSSALPAVPPQHPGTHREMLEDAVRTEAFREAIFKTCKDEALKMRWRKVLQQSKYMQDVPLASPKMIPNLHSY